jgi:hypothetical protein
MMHNIDMMNIISIQTLTQLRIKMTKTTIIIKNSTVPNIIRITGTNRIKTKITNKITTIMVITNLTITRIKTHNILLMITKITHKTSIKTIALTTRDIVSKTISRHMILKINFLSPKILGNLSNNLLKISSKARTNLNIDQVFLNNNYPLNSNIVRV